MGKMTPEGKVKKAVRELLAEKQWGPLKQHWPVPAGFGESSVDCLVCYRGRFIAIETKAHPHDTATPRQQLFLREIGEAGGIPLVIAGVENVERLRAVLEELVQCPQ